MTLDQARKGLTYVVKSIPQGTVQAQAIRFGVYEGEKITVGEIIPFGPIVIYKNRQEIAIGRSLARKIDIEQVEV